MSTDLFIPRRNSNNLWPSGMLKTLITVPWRGEPDQAGSRVIKHQRGWKVTKPPPFLMHWLVLYRRSWTLEQPEDCHEPGSASRCSKEKARNNNSVSRLLDLNYRCNSLYMVFVSRSHQVVGIINCDLSDGGAAGVHQVGVTLVHRKRAQTCKTAQIIMIFFLKFAPYSQFSL